MNDPFPIGHGYSSLNYSARQKIQSSQPASEAQVLLSHNLMLMVSIFYIAPTVFAGGHRLIGLSKSQAQAGQSHREAKPCSQARAHSEPEVRQKN